MQSFDLTKLILDAVEVASPNIAQAMLTLGPTSRELILVLQRHLT